MTGEPVAAARIARVAKPFGDAAQRHDAVRLGVWVFLASEVMLLGAAIVAFSIYRLSHRDAFAAASARLAESLGVANTAVLLTSSLTMALAVLAARADRRRPLWLLLLATAAMGIVFLGVKAIEYSREIAEGLIPGAHFAGSGADVPGQELFFCCYWLLTGIHAVHVVVGVVLLVALAALIGRRADVRIDAVIGVALYWHFVDVVWVFLFPLLYLVEAFQR